MRLTIAVAVGTLDGLGLTTLVRSAMLFDAVAIAVLVGTQNAATGRTEMKADGAVDVLHGGIEMIDGGRHSGASRSR